MTIVVPYNYEKKKKATIAIAEMIGPAYIRLSRANVPIFTDENATFELGKAEVLQDGTDVVIIACGSLVWESLVAAEELQEKHNISAAVINCHTIKPIDEKTLTDYAGKCKAVVTAEEHQIYGGLGSAVAEVLAKNCPTPMEFIAMQDRFGESGEPEELLKYFGFDAENIVKTALKVIARK
jgi:transketolase